jgi:hypothetical protein
MSVWPEVALESSLSGREGDLVSISVRVEARYLEAILEALAQVNFPINPQIYHDAAMVYVYPDGRQEAEATTLVEFPAYAARLDEVRHAVESHGFDAAAVHVTAMLDEIHSEAVRETPPAGAPYVSCWRVKNRAASAVH